MNKIANKLLLAEGKFLIELYLKQPRFTYNACGTFAKHHERIEKVRETGDLKHVYRNEPEKADFAPNSAYSDSKDLAKISISERILKNRAYEIAIHPKYNGN